MAVFNNPIDGIRRDSRLRLRTAVVGVRWWWCDGTQPVFRRGRCVWGWATSRPGPSAACPSTPSTPPPTRQCWAGRPDLWWRRRGEDLPLLWNPRRRRRRFLQALSTNSCGKYDQWALGVHWNSDSDSDVYSQKIHLYVVIILCCWNIMLQNGRELSRCQLLME